MGRIALTTHKVENVQMYTHTLDYDEASFNQVRFMTMSCAIKSWEEPQMPSVSLISRFLIETYIQPSYEVVI